MAEILTDNYDYDFIGFTYNGKHSINDLKIYRTSDGSRYNETLNPTITDKTVEIIGSEGPILTSSYHKTRAFQIKFAYDNLTEEEFYGLSKVFDGKGIHDLIFDECPYKVYKAKVTGTPSLKYICFEEGEKDIYKGEGTVNFTCYEPYAFLNQTKNEEKAVNEVIESLRAELWLEPEQYILFQDNTSSIQFGLKTEKDTLLSTKGETNINTITLTNRTRIIAITFDIKAGCKYQLKKYIGWELYGQDGSLFFPAGEYVCRNIETNETYSFTIQTPERHYSTDSSKVLKLSENVQAIKLLQDEPAPQDLVIISRLDVDLDNDFETVAYFNGVEMIAPTAECVNGYSLYDYPTRDEWALHSPLPLTLFATGKNYGDMPASFIVRKEMVNKGDILLFHGDAKDNYSRALRIEETCENFEWNTETGMVSGAIEGRTRAIKHYGNSTLKIPVGEDWSGYFTILQQKGYTITQNTRLY